MPSPICQVKAGAAAYAASFPAVSATVGDTMIIKLAASSGVSTWEISCYSTDETSTAPALTIDSAQRTATFTAPAAGKAFLFRSRVNQGLNALQQQDATLISEFKIYTPLSNGGQVLALGESMEGDQSFGWLAVANSQIRTSSGGAGVGFYGDASDGSVTLGSNTTLTRDMFYNTLNLAGYTLSPAGYRIFARSLIMASGTIANNGPTGNSSTGAGGAAAPAAAPTGSLGGSTAGGAPPGPLAANTTTGFGGAGGYSGGSYGNPALFQAAAAYSYAATAGAPLHASLALVGRFANGTQVLGGGGGQPGQRSNFSEENSGGSGGGVIVIASQAISGTGTIIARGGNGGAGGVGPTNCGGSGGGGGGVIFLISASAIPGTVTTNVTGGSPGTPLGNGSVGGTGAAGRVLTFAV